MIENLRIKINKIENYQGIRQGGRLHLQYQIRRSPENTYKVL